MVTIIPAYTIPALMFWMELVHQKHIPPMSPLQIAGASLLTGVALFVYVEYVFESWTRGQRRLQMIEQSAIQVPMREGEK